MSVTLKMAAGDILVDAAGQVGTVYGIEKCNQDIAETLLDNYDPFDPPWYTTGSEFYLIDQQIYAYSQIGIRTTIIDMASGAMERLKQAQEDDPYVDDEELISEIRTINVWQIGELSWAFYVLAITDSDDPVDLGFDIDLTQQLPVGVEAIGDIVPGIGTPL